MFLQWTCYYAEYGRSRSNCLGAAELVMGHFFKTQPNPKFLDPTKPNPQKSSPDPTQPIIDTWYGVLGYTENFTQQQLHVTDKFTVRSYRMKVGGVPHSPPPHFSSSTDSTAFADSCDLA